MGHFDTPWNEQQTLLDVDHNGWHNAASAQLGVGVLQQNHVTMRKFSHTGITGMIEYHGGVPQDEIFEAGVTGMTTVNTWYFIDWTVSPLDVFDAGSRLYGGNSVSTFYWGVEGFPSNIGFQLEKGVWYWQVGYTFTAAAEPDTFIEGYFDYISDYNAQVPGLPQFTTLENYYNNAFSSSIPPADLLPAFEGRFNSGMLFSYSDTECIVAPQFFVHRVSGSAPFSPEMKLRSLGFTLHRLAAGM